MDLYTKAEQTPFFKPDGKVHTNSPIRGIGTLVRVTGAITPINDEVDRGNCYRMSDQLNAYIAVDSLRAAVTTPPPASPGAARAVITLNETDGRVRYFDERLP